VVNFIPDLTSKALPLRAVGQAETTSKRTDTGISRMRILSMRCV